MANAFSSFSRDAITGRRKQACLQENVIAPALLAIILGASPMFVAAQTGPEGDSVRRNTVSASPRAQDEAARDRTEDAQRAVDRIFDDPLGGVVVNRTVTVLGKDFYRHFSTYWRQNQESTRYSISIHERPTARFGSEIWVLYRQQPMFHIFLPPARQATRGISEVAVHQVLENISRRELERLTTRNPDLGPEEL